MASPVPAPALSAIFVVLGGTLSSSAEAAIPEHLWSRVYGGASLDEASSVAVTADGGAIVTGYFHSTVNFGGGSLTSAGQTDIFVLRLDSSGNHAWSRSYGSASLEFGNGVSPTADGGALVTGVHWGTVDFGGGPLTSAGDADIFVLKLDAGGNHGWSRSYGSALLDYGNSISPTDDGGALVTGFFDGTVDFGGGPLTSAGGTDIFVLKLDPNGNHAWSRNFGSTSGDWGGSVSPTADGGALVTGSLYGTIDFGGGPLTSAGEHDVFVLRLDPNGQHAWSRSYGSTSDEWGYSVSPTADGGALVSGFFYGTVDFGGGPLTSAGERDVFVLKLDSSGNHAWSRRYGSASHDRGSSVSATVDDGALVTGFFDGTVDFGGGPLTSAGGADIFVLKLDPSGNHAWSRNYGSTSMDNGSSVSATADGGALVTGHFRGTVNFGEGWVASAGYSDIFVLKVGSNPTGVELSSRVYQERFDVFPNPSTNGTTFRLTTSRSGRYALSIYDVAGRTIQRFRDVTVPSGQDWTWDGHGADGRPVGAGAYFYVLRGPGGNSSGRLVLLR